MSSGHIFLAHLRGVISLRWCWQKLVIVGYYVYSLRVNKNILLSISAGTQTDTMVADIISVTISYSINLNMYQGIFDNLGVVTML